jgi:hypothetical protein
MAVAEAKVAGVVFDRVPALVDEPVMLEAEQDEVVEAGLAAVRPVPAMMSGEVSTTVAAGPAAAAVVSGLEQTAQRRRHRAPPAANAQGKSVPFEHREAVGVAAKPPCGLGSDHGTRFEVTPAGTVGRQNARVDMHEQLWPLRWGPVVGVRKRHLAGCGEFDERLHAR